MVTKVFPDKTGLLVALDLKVSQDQVETLDHQVLLVWME